MRESLINLLRNYAMMALRVIVSNNHKMAVKIHIPNYHQYLGFNKVNEPPPLPSLQAVTQKFANETRRRLKMEMQLKQIKRKDDENVRLRILKLQKHKHDGSSDESSDWNEWCANDKLSRPLTASKQRKISRTAGEINVLSSAKEPKHNESLKSTRKLRGLKSAPFAQRSYEISNSTTVSTSRPKSDSKFRTLVDVFSPKKRDDDLFRLVDLTPDLPIVDTDDEACGFKDTLTSWAQSSRSASRASERVYSIIEARGSRERKIKKFLRDTPKPVEKRPDFIADSSGFNPNSRPPTAQAGSRNLQVTYESPSIYVKEEKSHRRGSIRAFTIKEGSNNCLTRHGSNSSKLSRDSSIRPAAMKEVLEEKTRRLSDRSISFRGEHLANLKNAEMLGRTDSETLIKERCKSPIKKRPKSGFSISHVSRIPRSAPLTGRSNTQNRTTSRSTNHRTKNTGGKIILGPLASTIINQNIQPTIISQNIKNIDEFILVEKLCKDPKMTPDAIVRQIEEVKQDFTINNKLQLKMPSIDSIKLADNHTSNCNIHAQKSTISRENSTLNLENISVENNASEVQMRELNLKKELETLDSIIQQKMRVLGIAVKGER